MEKIGFKAGYKDLGGVAAQVLPRLFSDDAPTFPVYHYTTAKGLHGILRSETLRMTGDHAKSDPLELRYALNVFREAWAGRQRLGSHEVRPAEVCPFFIEQDKTPVYGTYFAAFTEGRDEPHHWQNFGDRGHGYGVGFRFMDRARYWTVLRSRDGESKDETNRAEGADDEAPGLKFGPVEYSAKAQVQAVEALLERADHLLAQPADVGEVKLALRQRMAQVLPFFKHESFQGEREWRLIAPRVSHYTPTYAEIQVAGTGYEAYLQARCLTEPKTLPITEIIVGPRVPATESAHIHALLTQRNKRTGVLEHVDVEDSYWVAPWNWAGL